MRALKAFPEKSIELLKFIKGIFSKKTLRKIADEFVSSNQSDGLKAFSAGFGIFMGIIPAWGLQTLAAVFIAVVFRLNKTIVIICSQISFPPFLPLILFFSYRIGGLWMGGIGGSNINRELHQYFYGGITLAVLAGVTVGFLTYITLKLTKALKQFQVGLRSKKILPAG
jgi:uncharacterized protein (DUF2062 family)